MAKIIGGVPPFIGTRDNLTIYLLNGEYIVRSKSSLTGKRVKRDPAFAKTMKFAGWLKQASRIASRIYRQMPADKRIYKQYRQLTGKAMSLLKEGFDATDVITMLEAVYLPQLMENTDNRHTSDRCEPGYRYFGNCNSERNQKCVEYSRKYRRENAGRRSCRRIDNCNSECNQECVGYSRKYRRENAGRRSCGCTANCNSERNQEYVEYSRKYARGYVYISEYKKSYYNWGDRPQGAGAGGNHWP